VGRTLDPKAVGALLANDSAQMREDTLDWIIDNAAPVEPWHKPLVTWPSLSDSAVRRLAGFVATSLVETLCDRNDIDAGTALELSKAVKREIDPESMGLAKPEPASEAAPEPKPAAPQNKNGGKDGASELFKNGGLDDDALQDAIGEGDRDFVVQALVLTSGLSGEIVNRVLNTAKPKKVTALAWKADFSMRTAMQLQLRIARVRPQDILNARDGIDYPLTEAELQREVGKFK
jgi:hypothetical protein